MELLLYWNFRYYMLLKVPIFLQKGAIEILNNLGIVDYLSGAKVEISNIFSSVATLFHEEPEEYRYLLKQYLNCC